ncbi:MAG: DUF302 domain-containing protein [Candidatus Neomarinimicrobiota bacterium]
MKVNHTFEQSEQKLRHALTEEGLGVITEIDVKNVFKQKLNIDYKKYKILGVCEPNTAYKALSIDEQIGLLLPCNVIIWENNDKSTSIAAIDARAQLAITKISELTSHADQINQRLKAAIDKI